MTDENVLMAQRREKLHHLKAAGNAYPNDFRRTHFANQLVQAYGHLTKEALAADTPKETTVAGRIMLKRVMGKSTFLTLQDQGGRIQLYVKKEEDGALFALADSLDIGDIVGAGGYVFKTNTGELSVHVTSLRLLTKNLRPLPEKFHGLADPELRYRYRYVDLMNKLS